MRLQRHALAVIRERSGLTQAAVAAAAGLSRGNYHDIETGRVGASPAVIQRIAKVLKVSLIDILADPQEEVTSA